MLSHKKLNSPSTALATTMSYRRNSSNLPGVYSKAALQCLIAAFPNARYWKKEMGELHTMPDCCSLEHKVSYMYVDESATPMEFRGPCDGWNESSVCTKSLDGYSSAVVQIGAFAPVIPGTVCTQMVQTGSSVAHTDAFCGRVLSSNSFYTVEESVARGDTPCPICNL